ncbi:MAG: ATP-binding cassette domain-containing protein [Burkholderiales bacterium]|nr:ATP-binding cassette domain-containing protein [Burkholderiales bacterium]
MLWAPLLAAIALLAAPHLSTATLLKATLWLSFGIVALSLSFIWGIAGIFSFGQNAFFGVGGYAFAVAAINFFPATGETMSAMLVAVLAAAAFAAVLGYVTFYGRVGDVYLAIVTLSVTLILYTVMSSTAGPEYRIGQAQLGGFNGMPSIPGIAMGSGEFSNRQTFAFAVCLAAALYAITRLLVSGRYGLILAGIRENEFRMELLGYDVRLHKLAAFVIGSAIAALGGALFAAWGTFINPAVFSLPQAALVAIWVMVGGRTALAGAFVGVGVVQWVADQADKLVAQQTPLVLGVMLVATVLAFPSGIVPALARLLPRQRAGTDATHADASPMPQPARPGTTAASRGWLKTYGLNKAFGGSVVLEEVSLEFGSSPIHAIIGPNGAGKSTLFGLLTGRHKATRGRIEMNGADITALPAYRRARAGLGIKLQVPSLFPDLTVRQNIELALMAPGTRGKGSDATILLASANLLGKENLPAATLSHGEQQWLEIAMVVAQGPSVMLLDEPAAGMTRDERARTADLIRSLAAERTVVVVEHDMAFIRTLQAPVVMLHRGIVFRQGDFEQLSRDPEVRDVYLGRQRDARR